MNKSSERVKAFRDRQKQQGRIKREFYLTNKEWLAIKLKVKELRDESS